MFIISNRNINIAEEINLKKNELSKFQATDLTAYIIQHSIEIRLAALWFVDEIMLVDSEWYD